MQGADRRRAALLALGGLAAVVAVLVVVAQLVLPGIAEDRLRDRLARHGTVERVEIHAFPAVKLLWGDADRVEVELGAVSAASGKVGDLLAETSSVDDLDASADTLRAGALTLHAVRLRKDGDLLVGSARVDDDEIRSAFPVEVRVTEISPAERGLRVQAKADLPFVPDITVPLLVIARGGALEVEPEIAVGPSLLQSLAQEAADRLLRLKLFDDSRIDVRSLTARPAIGGGYVVTARATLR